MCVLPPPFTVNVLFSRAKSHQAICSCSNQRWRATNEACHLATAPPFAVTPASEPLQSPLVVCMADVTCKKEQYLTDHSSLPGGRGGWAYHSECLLAALWMPPPWSQRRCETWWGAVRTAAPSPSEQGQWGHSGSDNNVSELRACVRVPFRSTLKSSSSVQLAVNRRCACGRGPGPQNPVARRWAW